jgi:ankyrin repeat protein
VTPLSWAAFVGEVGIAELLIQSGADVNATNRDRGTALHGAAFFGKVEVAELLIGKGADTNARHESGDIPLDSSNVDWETTQFIAGLLQVRIDREEVESGRAKIADILHQHRIKPDIKK